MKLFCPLALFFVFATQALIPPQESLVIPKGIAPPQSSIDIGKVLPTNIPAGADPRLIQTRIIDHSVGQFVKDQMEKNKTGIWAAAHSIKRLQGAIKIDQSPSQPGEAPIVHEFSFNMRALEQSAFFGYKGFCVANLNYNLQHKFLHLEISREVLESTKLVYSYSDSNSVHQTNHFSVRWDWN